MILAHLSDLHLRDDADAVEFARQLDRIVARGAEHLVITGDLLDRWHPPLLDRVLDSLADRGLLSARALTILHGNHDLASSGGHPRQANDLWRLALRSWDPPPLVTLRRRRFYQQIDSRSRGVAGMPPALKPLDNGVALAVVNTVPAPWLPFSIRGRELTLHHGRGAIARHETEWLARLPSCETLLVLTHHYPLTVAPYEWRRSADTGQPFQWLDRWRVVLPMEIRAADRQRFWAAVTHARATAVLCGHVHRARVDHFAGIAVGLNGQSGAAWAGRTIAYYRVGGGQLEAEYESSSAE